MLAGLIIEFAVIVFGVCVLLALLANQNKK